MASAGLLSAAFFLKNFKNGLPCAKCNENFSDHVQDDRSLIGEGHDEDVTEIFPLLPHPVIALPPGEKHE